MTSQPVTAYILIQTSANAADVARAVGKIPGVETADDVSGPYDVIVRVHAADLDSLGQLVVARLHAVDGIVRTLTCPVTNL